MTETRLFSNGTGKRVCRNEVPIVSASSLEILDFSVSA